MNIEITPEPSDEERRAVLAALAEAEAEAEAGTASPWADALLPDRADEP